MIRPALPGSAIRSASSTKSRRSCIRSAAQLVAAILSTADAASAASRRAGISPTNIFAPASTPAHDIFRLSIFGLEIEGAIFVVVFSLLAFAVVKFRKRKGDDDVEPPQVYGSNQIELAWTVVPVLT